MIFFIKLSHGYSEHINASICLPARFLAERGICTIGIDQRGFGKSEGIRG